MQLYNALAAGTPVEATANGVLVRPEITDVRRGGHPDAVAVVRTSGSTGTPKQTVLTNAGLKASAEATAQHIGGQGQWLLAVGTQYVAGLAVVSRSVHAGTTPVVIDAGFTAKQFVAATSKLSHKFTAVSLVPTQLLRLLDDDAALAALQSYSAILVGGAAIPSPILDARHRFGLNLFATYGMSETSGGCVYDGVALPGVTVSTFGYNGVQRIQLSGPMVAAGYFDDPELTEQHFGDSTFLTDDYGTVTNGVLRVSGRLDDVINTGGIKVSATQVEQVLGRWVPEAFVTGIADGEWGQRVCAVVTGRTDTEVLADAVRTNLGAPAVPKKWLRVEQLPMLVNGKPDRVTLTRWLEKE